MAKEASFLGTGWDFFTIQKSQAKKKGEITFIGTQKIANAEVQVYLYDKEAIELHKGVDKVSLVKPVSKKNQWINFHGIHDVDLIKGFAERCNIDRLTIRQILDTTLRPKIEEYDEYLFFSVKSVLKDENGQLIVEQLSFLLGNSYVASFQEKPADHFDHIRHKMNDDLGLVRKRGVDFLLYLLLDAIIDNYFETIESLNNEISTEEKLLIEAPTQNSLLRIEELKRLAETVKKSLNPLKDALKSIQNRSSVFIMDQNKKYFDDLTSSVYNAVEEIDSTIRSLEGLTNIYFSSLSQKMNETMKVLTTVATIFIPLTFIAGIYGMNFDYMPELRIHYGYFYTLGIMGLILVGMIAYFKKKNWL